MSKQSSGRTALALPLDARPISTGANDMPPPIRGRNAPRWEGRGRVLGALVLLLLLGGPAPGAAAECGDLFCEAGEDFETCPDDCGCPEGVEDGMCDPSVGEDPVTCPADCSAGCGDGFCDPDSGEDSTTCELDCGLGAVCGDGICDIAIGETESSCPQDCGGGWCGDGECTPGSEDASTCLVDCHCGDGSCTWYQGENPVTCPVDCLPPEVCGDWICSPGEDPDSCPFILGPP